MPGVASLLGHMSHAFIHQIFISHVQGLLLEIRAYEQRLGMGMVGHTCGPSLRRLRQGELVRGQPGLQKQESIFKKIKQKKRVSEQAKFLITGTYV